MGTTNETVVQLSDRDKELLGKVAAVQGYASGGYVRGGPIHREPTRQEKTLEEILEVLKEVRDHLVFDTSTPPQPAPMPSYPGQWYPWQAPYQHQPVWCSTPPTDPSVVQTTYNV